MPFVSGSSCATVYFANGFKRRFIYFLIFTNGKYQEIGKMSACHYEMKFPIRPAPPPPVDQKPLKSGPGWNAPVRDGRTKSTPVQKKKPPPRPPPPKFVTSKKSTPSRPGQLIADLFHRKNHVNSKPNDAPTPKPFESTNSNVFMLIDFSSPPSSPTLTTRSSSDALSVNSFGSDGVTQSSGSSGNGSNIESGFEDDFDLFGGASRRGESQPRDPWSPPPKPPGKTGSWVAFPSPGASRKAPLGVSTMPTIIRSKPEGHKPPQKACDTGSSVDLLSEIFQRANVGSSKPTLGSSVVEEEEDDSWSCESPPMPTCPPPAPPPEVFSDLFETAKTGDRPHGIALYDYAGEQPQDLSFRKGDVINLVRRIDENWYGGEMEGREGSVPANFIAVRVGLAGDDMGGGYVTALYAFRPETWDDLAFEEGSVIKVTHKIDQDWLYGECDGKSGQFPASFVDHVPSHLPLRRTG